MNNIPTAEEVMIKYIPNGTVNIKGKGDGKPQYQAEKDIIQKCMIEFAKLHVKAALEAASKVKPREDWYRGRFHGCEVDRDSILNAYPENLIK